MSDKKNKGGRPTLYAADVADAICSRLSIGESLRHICSGDDMPSQATVYVWLQKYPEFLDKYARARERQAEYWAEEILEIADDGTNDWMERENKDGSKTTVVDTEHIQRSRLRVDSRKWLMSKLAPKKYGDRLALAGDEDNPLNVKISQASESLAKKLLGIGK